MKQTLLFALTMLGAFGQTLPAKWEELTAEDFQRGIAKAQQTCVLPFGIIEKHGPQLPLGTDLINVRYVVMHAVEQEYAVVFPEYYFGQIFEARHEPGTMAYSAKLQLELLQETTDEMGRNGCKKIVIVNGHGGNNNLLPFFAQSQMAAPHDYVVYIFSGATFGPGRPQLKTKTDSHAGESEPSGFAEECLHGHLVVREISRSLRGRWRGGDEGVGRIRHEGLGCERRRCHSGN
jgi:creatinine amidohydrolase